MHKDIFNSISGVEIYPIIAMVIFFTFFITMVIRVIKLDKDKVKHMSLLPLKDTSFDNINGEFDDE